MKAKSEDAKLVLDFCSPNIISCILNNLVWCKIENVSTLWYFTQSTEPLNMGTAKTIAISLSGISMKNYGEVAHHVLSCKGLQGICLDLAYLSEITFMLELFSEKRTRKLNWSDCTIDLDKLGCMQSISYFLVICRRYGGKDHSHWSLLQLCYHHNDSWSFSCV